MGDVRHVGVGVRQDVVVTSSLPVADAARPASGAVLEAVLDRVTYANEETGYTIAGVSTSLAVRIYKKYGDASISVVRNEPYRLAADVWGIGFKTADTIAQAVGIPHDSPQRVQAGIQYTLSEAADNGHCYLPEPNLIAGAAEILTVPADLVRTCLDELAAADGVVREPVPNPTTEGGSMPAVDLAPFHRAETSLAGRLLRLLAPTA